LLRCFFFLGCLCLLQNHRLKLLCLHIIYDICGHHEIHCPFNRTNNMNTQTRTKLGDWKIILN
jgi:hypothetical protein